MTKPLHYEAVNDGEGVLDSDGVVIASVRRYHGHTEEAASYATLFAAAPDLLAALKALYEHCAMIHSQWGEGCNQREADAAIAAGRAAIAKAENSAS